MDKKILSVSAFLLLCHISVLPLPAYAVIPPDFIFNIGTQLAQLLSLVAILLTATFGAFFQFFKAKFRSLTLRRVFLNLGVLAIIAACFLSAYFFAQYKQDSEYEKWLEESARYETEQRAVLEKLEAAGLNEDANDQLNIGSLQNADIDTSSERFVSSVLLGDQSSRFIRDYYEYIADGKFETAYRMSAKPVDLATFKGWYRATTKITLDNLTRIDEKKSSVELTMYEGGAFTRYGALITLVMQGSLPLTIEKSEVKILANGTIDESDVAIDENAISVEYGFFSENEDRNIVMTNEEFELTTKGSGDAFIILDAREDIEFENGNFPGSVHIRFADLKAGRWIELPKDAYIYVLCWSGIRGKEVAEFLRTKRIVASYLENGASGWVDYGGAWSGGIRLAEEYEDERYQAVLSTDEVKEKAKEGVVLVDSREPYKFDEWHIDGSHSIPILYTPTFELEDAFGRIPQNSRVITVCDGYVNCFDAKVTGVELERRGHEFLGRYIKPWEYGD